MTREEFDLVTRFKLEPMPVIDRYIFLGCSSDEEWVDASKRWREDQVRKREYKLVQQMRKIEEEFRDRVRPLAEELMRIRESRRPGPVSPGLYVASKVKHAGMWRGLRQSGESIVSTWIDEAGEGQTNDYGELAVRCLSEIGTATALILYCEPGEMLKGALMEAGVALASGVPVYCVGMCDSISRVFIHHPLWHICESLEDAIAEAKAHARPNTVLRVDITNDALTISLPLPTLQTAVECFSDFEKWNPQTQKCDKPKLTDVQVFAKEVLHALLHEEEDGSTLVTKMFDRAFLNAVEDGAEGIVLPDDEWYEEETTTDSDVSEHSEIRRTNE